MGLGCGGAENHSVKIELFQLGAEFVFLRTCAEFVGAEFARCRDCKVPSLLVPSLQGAEVTGTPLHAVQCACGTVSRQDSRLQQKHLAIA